MRRLESLTVIAILAVLTVPGCSRRQEPAAPAPEARPVQAAKEDYAGTIAQWQKKRAERLTSEDGWLTLAGLYWLKPGENRVGSAATAPVRLPAKAPRDAGAILLDGGTPKFVADSRAGVTTGGKPVTSVALLPDAAPDGPTVLEIGPVSFYAIERAGKLGVRVKDRESDVRKNFEGLQYYPVDPRWRVEARFERYDPPKQIPIVNVLGMVENMPSPGALVFELEGKTYRLDPVLETGETDYFIMFGDPTNGKETYGAGRYLYASPPDPRSGVVIVDFNKAYNPPCAFTRFATCPLPPRQNRLPVAILAGEKKYEGATH